MIFYRFGPLDTFSAFRFENFLGKMKSIIKGGLRPLQQITNRLVYMYVNIHCWWINFKKNPLFRLVERDLGPLEKPNMVEISVKENTNFYLDDRNNSTPRILQAGVYISFKTTPPLSESYFFHQEIEKYIYPCTGNQKTFWWILRSQEV